MFVKPAQVLLIFPSTNRAKCTPVISTYRFVAGNPANSPRWSPPMVKFVATRSPSAIMSSTV